MALQIQDGPDSLPAMSIGGQPHFGGWRFFAHVPSIFPVDGQKMLNSFKPTFINMINVCWKILSYDYFHVFKH